MSEPVNLAVVGVGRIGEFHALHAHEVAGETGGCEVAALVDSDLDKAKRIASELGSSARIFASVEELIDSGAANASVVCTPTADHQRHANALIEAGHRVLLEKPMTEGLVSDRAFVSQLNLTAPNALMLAFQRRFDPPLQRMKQIAKSGAIGRPFKIVSILEDSNPAPAGFDSPGLFQDMSVHNVDEVMWLMDAVPYSAASIGNRLYSHRIASIKEDFDDGLLYLWFRGEVAGQIQVSRNHVPGYRIETWIFGEQGFVHMGHFDQRKLEITVEAYSREESICREVFRMRDYGRAVPEFVDRFGLAYKAEFQCFVDCCLSGAPFDVNQNHGLQAMEVIEAACRASIEPEQGSAVTKVKSGR
jgi:myo-inositol 2-dehydrogenase / D-chiro-inositol 1-dehydrogenase